MGRDDRDILDQPDTTYLLRAVIVADGSAIRIAASDIAVDPTGQRIIYANGAQPEPDASQAQSAASGEWGRSLGVTGPGELSRRADPLSCLNIGP